MLTMCLILIMCSSRLCSIRQQCQASHQQDSFQRKNTAADDIKGGGFSANVCASGKRIRLYRDRPFLVRPATVWFRFHYGPLFALVCRSFQSPKFANASIAPRRKCIWNIIEFAMFVELKQILLRVAFSLPKDIVSHNIYWI